MSAAKLIEFNSLDADIQELIMASVEARNYSYSPYSNFKVGAALRSEDGIIYKGCNIENSSYSVTICAERTAIAKAVSEGKKKFVALATVADMDKIFVTPCGVCRQTIYEFGDIPVYLTKSTLGTVLVTSAKELLPFGFHLQDASA